MARRKFQEINAGSMADIAFLLLIFFLVTTTMDIDKGLNRILPPKLITEEKPPVIKERNVFVVLLNDKNQLLVEGEIVELSNLREETKEFIANPKRLKTLPEFTEKEIRILGRMQVSKQITSLQNDRGTSYETYIAVQNELAAAYNELRDDMAIKEFGEPYKQLVKNKKLPGNSAKIDAIRKAIPQRISEAEPS
ncbi:MAG: biopolymer transporter ExbD [Flavobacteriales bacterium]|nr:biopolymer transporter ExbD [Flavobacteriales bacterium]